MKAPPIPDWVLEMPEPTRARYPDRDGFVERDGVRSFYEVYGEGGPTLLFFYPWTILHSRTWCAQIPYLARHFRVVVYDARGAGRSDRPHGEGVYRLQEQVADALAVMDATDTERAVLVTASMGARQGVMMAADHPERVLGAVFIAPFLAIAPWAPEESRREVFLEANPRRRAVMIARKVLKDLPRLASPAYRHFLRNVNMREASARFRPEYWRRDQRGYVEWFMSNLAIPDPHSTRQIERSLVDGLVVDAETLIESFVQLDLEEGAALTRRAEIVEYCARVRCPLLVIRGSEDLICPPQWSQALAEATGGRVATIEHCGHAAPGRKPVAVNLLLREFVESL